MGRERDKREQKSSIGPSSIYVSQIRFQQHIIIFFITVRDIEGTRMTVMMVVFVTLQVVRHLSCNYFPYTDTKGKKDV